MALGYAAIALVVLAIFLPVAMVWQQRKQLSSSHEHYQVRGGQSALVLAASCGLVIISAQFLQIFGMIPTVG